MYYPKVEEIQNKLESKDIRVHVDDREGMSPGYKFNDWELKGSSFTDRNRT